MQNLRLSVTSLDRYKYLCDKDADVETICRDMFGYVKETESMALGTAFHALMETRSLHDQGMDIHEAGRDGFLFKFDSFKPVRLRRPSAVEVKVRRRFRFWDVGEVDLIGRIDAVVGSELVDYKTTTGNFRVERLMESMQWRSYLAIDETAETFCYEMFRFNLKNRAACLMEHRSLRLPRYAGVLDDVRDSVYRLATFARGMASLGTLELDSAGRPRMPFGK